MAFPLIQVLTRKLSRAAVGRRYFQVIKLKAMLKAIKPYWFRIYPFRLRQYVGNNEVLIRTRYGFPVYVLAMI